MTRPDAPLEITRGDDITRVFIWHDNVGAIINLTGRTYRAQIRTSPAAAVSYPFVCTVNGSAGTVTFTMARTVTATIPTGQAWWDVEETVSGQATTVFGGRVTVYADVTR